MVKLKDLISEAKYKHSYKSITAMNRDMDRIWGTRNGLGNIGHPRVRIKRWSEVDKTGRMKPSYIEIEGDKMWVDAYKKLAFKGSGNSYKVIMPGRKETGDSNA